MQDACKVLWAITGPRVVEIRVEIHGVICYVCFRTYVLFLTVEKVNYSRVALGCTLYSIHYTVPPVWLELPD